LLCGVHLACLENACLVTQADSDFSMSGGEISGNTAFNQGGGVYVGNGVFSLRGGKLSGNTAIEGADVYTVYGYGWLSDSVYSVRNMVIICVGVAGVMGVVLFVYFRKKRANNEKITQQVDSHVMC